jgi:hypothetical protein
MQLTLRSEEVSLLQRVLLNYLSDLRMEIVDTEDYELREALHVDETTLKQIITRLGEADPRARLDRKVA